jgi:hypothetical protein
VSDNDYLLDMVRDGIDLGHSHHAVFTSYRDVDKAGLMIVHPAGGQNHIAAGDWCAGGVNFDLPVNAGQTTWSLVSLEPLHIEPSVLCSCGDHGFIHAGRWVPA